VSSAWRAALRARIDVAGRLAMGVADRVTLRVCEAVLLDPVLCAAHETAVELGETGGRRAGYHLQLSSNLPKYHCQMIYLMAKYFT
jgi:hypothetical protein